MEFKESQKMAAFDPSQLIVEELDLESSWGIFKAYMSDMEDYLDEATSDFESDIEEQKKTLEPEQHNQFHMDHVWDYVYYYDEFPYILRNSFLVSAYFLFEYDLRMICKNIKERHKLPISLSDLKGGILDQVKLFWRQAKIDLPYDNKTWEEIKKYGLIRNCIVHTNGLVTEEYSKDFQKYIKEKGLIKEKHIKFDFDIDTEPEIGLGKKFCEEVVETLKEFILAIYKSSKKLDK